MITITIKKLAEMNTSLVKGQQQCEEVFNAQIPGSFLCVSTFSQHFLGILFGVEVGGEFLK